MPPKKPPQKPLKKFRWGVTSLSASQWIPWIAKDARLYEKHGMDAELIFCALDDDQDVKKLLGMELTGANLAEFREKAKFMRISAAALRESHAHDVTITRESPNYPGRD